MLMPTADRRKIYEKLFEDGVAIAKKDFQLKSHPEIEGVRNLYVIKACRSLASRGYAKEQFAWNHYYWYLTDEGIEYLRDYLGLAADVIPLTHKTPKTGEIRQAFAEKAGRTGFRGDSDRAQYRNDKVTEAGPGSQPVNYRGGFGRGGAPQ
ncbi:unnamed protein product [Bursaphelenchus xylophilus]|uniref:(pine wood nematode) hypothetical protein n=1 Tax=Bursaphelenchus xylophilus TaxID=6326 RepID=A0A1I7SBY0_BURXY|nr:unnamed protein product [Bursaphelenchus xylophilus]CAG9089083.1 unnamed protein product [Bursaphelenchus xylophilus]